MKPSGALLVKCFKDMGFNDIVLKFRKEFKTVTQKKPKASRDKSSEIFLLGRGLKNPTDSMASAVPYELDDFAPIRPEVD